MIDGLRPVATLPEDLRQTTRNPVSWRARVSVDGSTFIDCRTFDISLGGVGLLCDQAVPRDVVLLVALQLPAPGPVVISKATAMFQILSGRAYRVGMKWVTPDDPARAALDAWLRR